MFEEFLDQSLLYADGKRVDISSLPTILHQPGGLDKVAPAEIVNRLLVVGPSLVVAFPCDLPLVRVEYYRTSGNPVRSGQPPRSRLLRPPAHHALARTLT